MTRLRIRLIAVLAAVLFGAVAASPTSVVATPEPATADPTVGSLEVPPLNPVCTPSWGTVVLPICI